MRATLQILTDRGPGRRIEVRQGQVARLGRTERADFALGDDQLAEVHFSVECDVTSCRLRHLASGLQTFVNETVAEDVALANGDRIRAGRTILVVILDQLPAVSLAGDVTPEKPVPEKDPRIPAADWLALLKYLELDPATHAVVQEGLTREAFIDALAAAEQPLAAARVRAHFLEPRAAVWWGCCCLDVLGTDTLPPEQLQGYEAARQWVHDPNETRRRGAEAAAEAGGFGGPGAMLAAAAFWSGDSLAPENAIQPVPPDRRLTGRGVATALLMASYWKEPRLAPERWPQFLGLGRDVADEKLPVPPLAAVQG